MFMANALDEYKQVLRQQERSPKTVQGYLQDLRFFKRWLEEQWNGPAFLEDVKFSDVESFLSHLKEDLDYKPASRKRIASAMKSFFRFAWKRKMCPADLASDIEDVKYTPPEREYLTEEEALQFIDAIDHKLVQMFVTTLFYTGMRISEALALSVEDVDIGSGWIAVRHAKGRKTRKIPICNTLREKLLDYVGWRVFNAGHFFATKKTGKLSVGTVQNTIRGTRERLGCTKNVTAHVFRHSFASELVRKDVNIVSISRLLGHSNLKTTSVYTHVAQDQLIEAVLALDKPKGGVDNHQ